MRWGRCHSEPGGGEAGSQCKHESHFKMDFGMWTIKCPPNQRAALRERWMSRLPVPRRASLGATTRADWLPVPSAQQGDAQA